MAVTHLRSRAICAGCESRLPPRTEAWWEEETRTAVCLSCARAEGLLAAPPTPDALPAAPERAPEPEPEPAPEPAAEVEPEPAPEPAPEVEPEPAPEVEVEDRPPLVARVAEADPAPEAESTSTPPGPTVVPPPEPLDQPPLATRPVTPLRAAPAAAAGGGRRYSSEGANAIDEDDDADEVDAEVVPDERPDSGDDGHVQSAAELIGRLRSVPGVPPRAANHRDPLVVERPDPSVDRGPVGDSRVTQTLEAARIHGVEVLHGRRLGGDVAIDHLVIAVNGIWTVVEQETLVGSLEKRDLGDWFTADARLFIGEHDRTDLVERARKDAEVVRDTLLRTPFTTVPVRPVVCFGTVPPGWVEEPFVVGGVSITWRNHLVEPMLDPVLLDRGSRHELIELLAAADD